jgi:hypothetical protein
MNYQLPIAIDAWKTEFDPYGLRISSDWLQRAERVEDILLLSSLGSPERVLDVGFYIDRYRGLIVENSKWDEPVEQFESQSPHTASDWVYSAISRYA